MDTSYAARQRRLEAGTAETALPFDYDGLVERHAARTARAQRRHRFARAAAGVLVVAFVGASVWRLEPAEVAPKIEAVDDADPAVSAQQPRIVRADTYLALAALEDHIARVDDAISVARMYAPH